MKHPAMRRESMPHAYSRKKLRILETYALTDGQWTVTGLYQDQEDVSAAPFEAVTIVLNDLWTNS
ncbi:hypothetical protein [Methylocaldum marinum]|uniref:hypothetical protein n=1 Tax=Methylocaldum marinum TaxID=1432792 RepID=UPI0011AE8B9B|nr:hypothetical protein [Methylocaldum marinum]